MYFAKRRDLETLESRTESRESAIPLLARLLSTYSVSVAKLLAVSSFVTIGRERWFA